MPAAPAASTWDWSADEMRRIADRVADLVVEHLARLPEEPVFRPYPSELAQALVSAPPPERGVTPDQILDEFAELIEPYPFGNGHPRFFGWVNSPPAPMAVFGEALAAAMNPSVAGGNHAAVWIEHQVLEWFKSIFGLPSAARGLLVSGGSMATLTALAVARHSATDGAVRTDGIQGQQAPLAVYMSEEGHSCIRKAVELLGIGSRYLRTIGVDGDYRMRPDALESAIRSDLAAGLRPMAVAASAGTVNSGAVDPLPEILEICRRQRVWCHVDAAYGGPAILTERYRGLLAPLAEADSVALDPHKWLFVPIEAGLVLVRDGAAMREAFSLVPPYLRTDDRVGGIGGPPWFSEFGFQQTRGFRALKVWMALKRHGLDGYREAIDRNLDLAARLAQRIEGRRELELVAAGLSIVCFRVAPVAMAGDAAALESLNRAVLEDIQLGGQVFLSSTVLEGRFCLRACIVNPRTSAGDVDAVVDLVADATKRLANLPAQRRPAHRT